MELLTAAALLGLAAPDTGIAMQLVLPLTGDAERRVVRYQCEGVDRLFHVEYLNAPPNFLAIIPIAEERLVFASTIAASGVRYVAGPFEWWTSGPEATFSDLRDDPPAPVACTEASETP